MNFEKMNSAELDYGAQKEANEQLRGIELSADPESLADNYNQLFENIESRTLQDFCAVLEQSPVEVKGDIASGNTQSLIDHVTNVLKWSKKKAAQLVVFALVSAAAAPAFGAGNKGMFNLTIPEGGIAAQTVIPHGGIGEQMTVKKDADRNEAFAQEVRQWQAMQGDVGNDEDGIEDDRGNVQATGRIIMGKHRT